MEADRIKELGEAGRLHPLIKTMVRAGYTGGSGKKGFMISGRRFCPSGRGKRKRVYAAHL